MRRRGFHPYRMMHGVPFPTILVSLESRVHRNGRLSRRSKIWIAQSDGSQRPGIFVSDAEIPGWFGGAPAAYVVYPDTRSGEEVSMLQITPREEGEEAT